MTEPSEYLASSDQGAELRGPLVGLIRSGKKKGKALSILPARQDRPHQRLSWQGRKLLFYSQPAPNRGKIFPKASRQRHPSYHRPGIKGRLDCSGINTRLVGARGGSTPRKKKGRLSKARNRKRSSRNQHSHKEFSIIPQS
jgi:hypothetical protein